MATKTVKKVSMTCDNCGKEITTGLMVKYNGGHEFKNLVVSESGDYIEHYDSTLALPVGEFCNFDCYMAYVKKVN